MIYALKLIIFLTFSFSIKIKTNVFSAILLLKKYPHCLVQNVMKIDNVRFKAAEVSHNKKIDALS
jgi:hypothetical protein